MTIRHFAIGRTPGYRTRFLAVLAAVSALGLASGPAAASDSIHRDVIGRVTTHIISAKENLLDIARKAGLGYTEIITANPGIDPWIPREGTVIELPTAHILPNTPHEGIVLNLADQRLYYFPPDGGPVQSFAVGIGREAWSTPMGSTEVVRKKANPTWHVPQSIRADDPTLPEAVPPGPDNPLGRHAIYLGWSGYLLHGTNKPDGVGRRVSHGCVRMYPEGIAKVFAETKIGTKVTVVDQQAKLGWLNGELMLEVHPSQSQADQVESTGRFEPEPVPELEFRVMAFAGEAADRLDWDAIKKAAEERRGIPVQITRPRTSSLSPDDTKSNG